jgi:hypothetical protein
MSAVTRPSGRPAAACTQQSLQNGQHEPAAQALQDPEGDEHRGAGGQAGADRGGEKQGERAHPHGLAAEAVDEPAGDRHGHAEGQQVAGGHPLDGRDAGVQFAAQRVEGDVDDRGVEDDGENAGEQRQREAPEGGVEPGGLFGWVQSGH